MQRLLNLRIITQNNIKLLSINKIGLSEDRLFSASCRDDMYRRQCAFLRDIYGPRLNFQPARHQMTTARAGIPRLSKRKRKKCKNKKWTELLQITDDSMTQTRTKVEKLKAKSLSEFINQPPKQITTTAAAVSEFRDFHSLEYKKINLDMFEDNAFPTPGEVNEVPVLFVGGLAHKIHNAKNLKEILASYEQFKAVTSEMADTTTEEHFNYPSTLPSEPILEDEMELITEETAEVIHEGETEKSIPIQPTLHQPKAKNHRFKSKQHKSPEHEQKAKQKALLNNLNTYIEVCVETGMLNRGLATLLHCRHRSKNYQSAVKIVSIEPYNIIMHGFADKGNYGKIREIYRILKEDKIPLNVQSFAAIFECLGRQETNEVNTGLLQMYRAEAADMGITLNDIMDKSKFLYDQREIVLDAIRRIDPEFIPLYTHPDLSYCNPLVNELNKQPKSARKQQPQNSHSEQRIPEKVKYGLTLEKLERLSNQQLDIELKGTLTVKSIESVKDMESTEKYRSKLGNLQNSWKSQISAAISRDLNILRAQVNFKCKSSMNYYTYLKSLDTGQFVEILLKEVRMLAEGSESYSPTVGQLYKELGQKVYTRYQIERRKRNGILEKTGEIYTTYCEKWTKSENGDNSRKLWQKIVHENRHSGPSVDYNEKVWPPNVMVGVGRFLYNILMRDIKIDANVMRNTKTQNILPAFYTVFRNEGKYVKEEVKPHPVLSRLFRASQQRTLTFDANLVPMICPPQPWSTTINGGYLLSKCDLIRLPHQAIQQWSRINESDPRNLYPCLDSLNQLASIPWKVNTNVLDVILKVFNDGGDTKLDVPQPPTALEPIIEPKESNLSNKEKYNLFRQKLARRRKQAEMYSLWCDTLYRLSLANHYRDKVFWLPHNMDFRGRVYPIPPHLNHLGSDLARSLLVFYEPKPLGTDGLNWLKLHCINLTGKKKRNSIRERLLYAEKILDDIIDSAENPLTGRMWWADSDEPWQTLACCMEISNVLKSPKPEKYMCRFPIHQDGSCNGLQHYAALGRDQTGAVSVNLVPCNEPQDVYSSIAALVENSRAKDEENNIQVAKILNGFVRRKVIKQTVMTTVYGVTRYGARLQIAKQLKDIPEFPKEWVWPASTYLTTKTFESLREMFTSTKEIQDWLTDCARLISAISGQNVEWITPLGLPVVQPYSRAEQKLSTKLSVRVNGNTPMDMYEKPNVVKQKNAFPPNFIHSLDSSHMMLTSLNCERKGITFISVHDCFWTHACTVPDMNKVCREQFVALHSQHILEDLSKYLMKRFSYTENDLKNDGSTVDAAKHRLNRILAQLPQKGDFNLRNVLQSVYFFS